MTEIDTWVSEDDEAIEGPLTSLRAVDLAFHVQSQALPVDHARALSGAVMAKLPWLVDEPLAGLHLIHVAGSGNGWMRPEAPDALLYPSRRTRLMVRVPLERAADARALSGQTLELDGQPLKVGQAQERPLVSSDVLLSRYVLTAVDEAEGAFLQRVANELRQMGLTCRKILPGRRTELRGPEGPVQTCSLMVADLTKPESITLQEAGLGGGRHFGCGLFIPHKGLGT